MTAGLLPAIVLIPTVLNGFGPAADAARSGFPAPAVWAWIPATAFGGAAAGALTSALASNLLKLQLPGIVLLSLVAGMGGLLIAATQVTMLQRVLARCRDRQLSQVRPIVTAGT
ncbi:MAG: hypothetical protein ABI401_03250 [Candidatus Dormibacter sp.]